MGTGVKESGPVIFSGGHSEIEWFSWVPNEKRAGEKRYEIGSWVSPRP